jgi:hypothetical protein
MNCPKCGEKMHLHELRVRVQLPGKDGEKAEVIETRHGLVSVDVVNPTRAIPLVGYMCPNLRCGMYVITPEG